MIDFQPFDPLKQASTLGNELIKTQIRNLFDSYSGEWDILVELIQNAVDALDNKFSDKTDFKNERPEIEIYINQNTEIIRVSDNGIGICPEDAKKIIAPNFTKKPRENTKNAKRFRGHKGVGLTYIAYFSNSLRYATKNPKGEFKGEISNTREWVFSNESDEEAPKVKPTNYNPKFYSTHKTGSSFEVKLDSQYLSRKNINWLGWEFIIRNYTAAGFCSMEKSQPWAKYVIVNFTLIDKQGNEVQPPSNKSSQIEFKFQFPNDILNPVLDLRQLLEKYKTQSSIPVTEKNKYVGMYQIWKNNQLKDIIDDPQFLNFANQYDAVVYGFFAHTASIWKEMNKKLTVDNRRKFWKQGIQIITENMPTGRMIDIDLSYGGGNKDRTYIVIELSGARPDYGRKTFDDLVISFSQYTAQRVISHLVKSREVLRSTDVPHGGTNTEQQYNSDQRIESVRELEDLDINYLPFIKVPQFEQDVVGLFHILVGADILKGYKILSVSSGAQYDGIIKYFLKNDDEYYYSPNNLLGIIKQNFPKNNTIKTIPKNIEFKYYLSDLVLQFNPSDPSAKIFDDIHWAVTWELGDEEAYNKTGYFIEDLTKDELHSKREYYGITHLLYSQGNRPINVIILKDVIKLLKKQL